MFCMQNKTQPTKLSARQYIADLEHAKRREDGLVLLDFFNWVTGLKPVLWGTSIIGYGRYAYQYESGRSGEFFLTGFSPRKSALTIYIMPGYRDFSEPLSRLGKHRLGKSCLYINKLEDVALDVLEEMVLDGVAYMREHYQTWNA